ncbi:MAG: hypothetical protein V1811_01030 [Candidatus Micrarchaeota archaeon]
MTENVSEFSEALITLGKAESSSKNALEKAERGKQEIIAGAISKASQLREDCARRAEQERDGILLEERKKTEAECAKLLAEPEKRNSRLVKADFERVAKKLLPLVISE